MGEEVVITLETPEPKESVEVVEPVVVVAPELPTEVLEELTALREFKRADDERRIREAEEDAAAALVIAELALENVEPVVSEEVEEELAPVEVEEIVEDTPPADVEPSNSHSWFKNWFS